MIDIPGWFSIFMEFLNKIACIDCAAGFPSQKFPVVKYF